MRKDKTSGMKKISNLTVCIIARNEEHTISRAIKSVSKASEVIVIDDYSVDKTREVAGKLGAQVYKRHMSENFAAQRNFALRKAKCQWVLFIDADEYLSPELMSEIDLAIRNNDISGYLITRKDNWLGKTLHESEWGNIKLLRLAQRKKGLWQRSVHEKWVVRGKIKSLTHPLIHTSHEDVASFIDQIAFHSRLHAKENTYKYKRVSLFIVIFYPVGKFVKNWLLRKGYKDGTRGFLYAMFMSLHSFLAWSHIYIQQNEKKH